MHIVERANALDGVGRTGNVEHLDETSTAVATNFFRKRLQPGFPSGACNHGAPAPCERKRQTAPDARGSTRHQCALVPVLHPAPIS